MTDCPNGEMRDLLPDLLHGRLPDAERRAVEEHVASCADCRAELALLTQLRGAMRRAPAVDVGAIASAIGRAPLPAARTREPARRSWGGWRVAAAITAIAVGGTSVAIARREPGAIAPSTAVAPTMRHDTSPVAASNAQTALATTTVTHPASPPARHQLAAAGAVSDLTDRELAALIGDLESIDVIPSADVEAGTLVPASGTHDMDEVL